MLHGQLLSYVELAFESLLRMDVDFKILPGFSSFIVLSAAGKNLRWMSQERFFHLFCATLSCRQFQNARCAADSGPAQLLRYLLVHCQVLREKKVNKRQDAKQLKAQILAATPDATHLALISPQIPTRA